MKFAKNKTKASSGNEQPEKKPGKKRKSAKIAKEQAGPRLKKLGAVGLNQSLVVLVAGVVAVALAHFLAVVPAGEAHYETASAMEADTAQRRLNQSLTALQKQVQAVANQRSVALALAERSGLETLAGQLQAALPGSAQVFVFPYREVPRTGNGERLLGFAGLELARRAEKGQSLLPDAFPRDDQWYLQFAAAVRHPTSNAVVGSVVAVFEASHIRPLLTVSNPQLGGKLSLVQSVSGASRIVASTGSRQRS